MSALSRDPTKDNYETNENEALSNYSKTHGYAYNNVMSRTILHDLT